MKRILPIIAAITIILSLCSCGKPEKTSDAMYQIGLNALATADDYIEGKISGSEADAKLKEYSAQATAQYDEERKEAGTEYKNDFNISFCISMLEYEVFDSTRVYEPGPMSDVKESRDKLATSLGK